MDPVRVLFEAFKATIPSWTLWLATAWVVLSFTPDVLTALSEAVAGDSQAGAVRLAAASLFVARLRTLVLPVIQSLWKDDGA